MTERLLRNGHKVVAFDRTPEVVDKYAKDVGEALMKELNAEIAKARGK